MFDTLKSLTCVAVLMMATASHAAADAKVMDAGFIEDVGASERINFSGKLRMLSQRIPAAACFAHAKIETDTSAALLKAATAEFDLIIKGLEFGEESLGIRGAETDRKVLIDINKLHTHWEPLHSEIADIIANGGSDEEVIHIARSSHEVLSVAKHLVSVLVGEYSDPTALLQTDAMTIDIAGRQRMLAQRISKNMCLVMSGFDTERAQKELGNARQIYDASLNALRFGMPEAGIAAVESTEIIAKLDSVLALWTKVQPILDRGQAGENLGTDEMADLFHSMNSLTGQMNEIVGMYNTKSKLGL